MYFLLVSPYVWNVAQKMQQNIESLYLSIIYDKHMEKHWTLKLPATVLSNEMHYRV